MKVALLTFLLAFSVLRADQSIESLAYKILSSNAEEIDSLEQLPLIIRKALTEKLELSQIEAGLLLKPARIQAHTAVSS